MKKFHLLSSVLLLIIGCSSSIDLKIDFGKKKSVDYNSLLQRNGSYYEINTEESFSGLVIDKYKSGQYRLEGYLRKGKWDGLVTEYYENGQKKVEGTFKGGKEVGSHKRWNKDGSVKF